MLTKEQVKNMINQALQGLNEVWEKEFLSLERKISTISSSYMVPDVSKMQLLFSPFSWVLGLIGLLMTFICRVLRCRWVLQKGNSAYF
jgi:hypothetical protein